MLAPIPFLFRITTEVIREDRGRYSHSLRSGDLFQLFTAAQRMRGKRSGHSTGAGAYGFGASSMSEMVTVVAAGSGMGTETVFCSCFGELT